MELGKLFYTLALEGMDEFQADVKQSEGQTESSSNKMIEAFKKIGAAIATYLTVQSIINFGKAVVDAAATVSAEASAFEQIMGDYSNTAQEKMKAVADATGVVDTRLTSYMTSMTAKFKGLGYDIDDATTLAADGLTLASDAAAFWDKSLDDSMSHLNSFINGSYQGGEAIGLFANDTQMAQFAIKQGVVESTSAWASLDEATKQATRLEYAKQMYEQSGATGQAAKESEQYANVQGNLAEKWRQFKAQIGEPILQNIVLPAMQKLSDLVDKASAAMQFLSEHSKAVKAVLITLGTAIGIVTTALTMQAIVQATKAAMNAKEVTTLGALIAAKWADAAATMAALAPYLLIAAAIAALIAVIVLLVKNWDKVKEVAANVWEKVKETWSTVAEWFKTNVVDPVVNFFTELWNSITTIWESIKTVIDTVWNGIKTTISNTVINIRTTVSNVFDSVKEKISNVFNVIKTVTTNIWNGIKTAITTPIESAKDKIKSIVDTIKGFFSGMKLSFPSIKLPHFSVTPSGWKIGDLLKGSIPKLGISWYAKGGILNKPTIFDYDPRSGNAKIGGEAGAEAVAPIDTLLGYIRTAVAEQNGDVVSAIERLIMMLADYLPQLLNKNNQLVLDTGVLVGSTARAMNDELGVIYTRNERGG